MPRRYFTVDEANELLPRICGAMTALLQLHSQLRHAASLLAGADVRVSPSMLAGDSQLTGTPAIQRQLARARGLYQTLREEVERIEVLGPEVKDLEAGLVDFHSWLDGRREVLLCWKVGESAVSHYHDLQAGFSGRKPVAQRLFENIAVPSDAPGKDA